MCILHHPPLSFYVIRVDRLGSGPHTRPSYECLSDQPLQQASMQLQ